MQVRPIRVLCVSVIRRIDEDVEMTRCVVGDSQFYGFVLGCSPQRRECSGRCARSARGAALCAVSAKRLQLLFFSLAGRRGAVRGTPIYASFCFWSRLARTGHIL
ncbi:hypothetical protein EVAR_36395_1 [Eumeta japonica]|uniref:Uncharacterized protein n=1 Tax=Eumeta variegata TaxID=151549 RepID=A0A4C1W785_EUMVA|nr:hypothetical protein EVAR_36395_1 [Eumeta japonica]